MKNIVNDSIVRSYLLELPRPSTSDNRSDERRLREGLLAVSDLKDVDIPLPICRELPTLLRRANYHIRAVILNVDNRWELVAVDDRYENPSCYGVAVDLGSTGIVFYLVDLSECGVVDTLAVENPQIQYGEDILTRIQFASAGDGLQVLQRGVVECFNKSIKKICEQHAVRTEDIYAVSVSGNTTMAHLFLGLDPSHLCKEPYIPVVNTPDMIPAVELGISIHPLGRIYVLPNMGSYVGGDILAGILVSGMHRSKKVALFVDVGTNAEVVLGNSEWMIACAGAAGPALEGGVLKCGTRAQKGAIEHVTINRKRPGVSCRTIEDGKPFGICGSGVIHLLAELFLAGLVDSRGELSVTKDPSRIVDTPHGKGYVVVFAGESAHGEDILITEADIKNLMRSKGAMFTILSVITQKVGITFEEIKKFFVAGTFGNYIEPQKAIAIGMLPDIPLKRYTPLGNASGKAAVEVLLSNRKRKELYKIRDNITYLEMNINADFMSQFTSSLFLPHTDLSLFPSVAKALKGGPRIMSVTKKS
jgi:uncharacterized 2Fe-2S/4Fe-4S cluster protein (DUF4445 family)